MLGFDSNQTHGRLAELISAFEIECDCNKRLEKSLKVMSVN